MIKTGEIEINGKKYPIHNGMGTVERIQDELGTTELFSAVLTEDENNFKLSAIHKAAYIMIDEGTKAHNLENNTREVAPSYDDLGNELLGDRRWGDIAMALINHYNSAFTTVEKEDEEPKKTKPVAKK